VSGKLVPYLATARFSGADAGNFLQAQLSADILALKDGENTLACYCTPKGQVLGLLLVERRADGYDIAARDVLLPGILQRLRMYVLRSKVEIDAAPGRVVVGAPGPAYRFADDGRPMDDEATWRAHELRAGVAWLDEVSRESYIPQMLGYDALGAVSFQKGCYPGQEIVARARYLGKVKRKPVIAELQGAISLENGGKLRLMRGGEWSDAVLVDHAGDGARTVLFTVARAEPEAAVESVETDGRRYACATT
jgi:folate-binding protein YgfZ